MIKLDRTAFDPLYEEERELMEAAENTDLESAPNPERFEAEALEAITRCSSF